MSSGQDDEPLFATDGGQKSRAFLEAENQALREENERLLELAEQAIELRMNLATIIRRSIIDVLEGVDGVDTDDIDQGRGIETDGGHAMEDSSDFEPSKEFQNDEDSGVEV